MSDLTFGIRITADGKPVIVETKRLREGLDDVGDGAKRATSALTVMGGALGALQLDRLISDAIAAARETINFAASLNDLSTQTGSSVEDLSALANMAKFSGVSFGAVEQALTQFSRRLSAADDESKRAGAALRLLGIEARDPAQAFNEVAQKLAQYADGANKAALAQEIFGRSGAQLLPLLKDLAEQGEIGTRITGEQAAEAERLNKEIARLSIEFTAFRDVVLGGVVPAFADLLEQFREGIKLAGSFGRALLDFGLGLNPFSNVGEQINDLRKKIEEGEASFIQRTTGMYTKQIEVWKSQLEFLKLLQRQAIDTGDALTFDARDYQARQRPAAPTLPGRSPAAGRSSDAEERRAAAAALREWNQQAEAMERARQKSLADERKELEQLTKAYYAQLEAEDKNLTKRKESIAQYEEATDRIGKTEQQIIDITVARLKENKAILQRSEVNHGYVEAIDNEIAALERRKKVLNDQDAAKAETSARDAAAKAALAAEEEWRRSAEAIGNTLTDALMRGFESGKDAAKNLRDTLVNMFKTLVLRPIIQAVLAPIAGSFAGFMPGSAGASGLLGGGGFNPLSMLGGGSSMGGFASGFTSLFGASDFTAAIAGDAMLPGALGVGGTGALSGLGAFGAGLASPFATIGAGLSATFGAGGGLGAGLAAMGGVAGALGAAVPIIGIGLAIASALGAFERGGPKTGGFAGNAGAFGERFFTPNQQDSAAQAIRESTNSAAQQLARALGSTATIDTAFGFDKDPEGDAGSRVRAGVVVNGRVVRDTGNVDVGRDESAVQAGLELEAKRSILAALQASDLPEQIARVMNSLSADTATASQVDTITQFASAMKLVMDSAKPGVGDDAQKAWEAATASATQRLRTMGTELAKLAKEQDGSVEKMQALGAATAVYRQAVTETLVAIRQIGVAVRELLSQTRETIEFAGLDNQGAYDLARSRGNALLAQIEATEDPAEVQRLAERINGYLLQAFNLLSPEEQLAKKPEYLSGLSVLDQAVGDALTRIGATIEGEAGDPFAAVNEALESATVKFDDAATKQGQAADAFSSAVTRFEGAVERLENIEVSSGFTLVPSEVGP